MIVRHASELLTTLETVQRRGWALVEWSQLYLWYGIKKIKKEPYRDIADRWDELPDTVGSLYVRDVSGGLLLLRDEPESIDNRK
jgi:hypothetical protein